MIGLADRAAPEALSSPGAGGPVLQVKMAPPQGRRAGSVSGARDSWSWGHELEPHVGYRVYLKDNKIL